MPSDAGRPQNHLHLPTRLLAGEAQGPGLLSSRSRANFSPPSANAAAVNPQLLPVCRPERSLTRIMTGRSAVPGPLPGPAAPAAPTSPRLLEKSCCIGRICAEYSISRCADLGGDSQNSQVSSSPTDWIAQLNLSRSVLEKNFSIGTLNLLEKTTVRRGSM